MGLHLRAQKNYGYYSYSVVDVSTDRTKVRVCCEDVTRWTGSVGEVLAPPSNVIINNKGSN